MTQEMQVGELGTRLLLSAGTLAAGSAPAQQHCHAGWLQLGFGKRASETSVTSQPWRLIHLPCPGPRWPWHHHADRTEWPLGACTCSGSRALGGAAGTQCRVRSRSSAAPRPRHAPRGDTKHGAHQRGFHLHQSSPEEKNPVLPQNHSIKAIINILPHFYHSLPWFKQVK